MLKEMAALRMSELIFPGTRGELSNMSMTAVFKRMGRGDLTVHGMRSAFKDWASEMTNHPDWVSEKALAHLVGDGTRRAYQRGDLFAKRMLLMADWGRYCTLPPVAETAKVVSIRR
jgi:hypothetical protein